MNTSALMIEFHGKTNIQDLQLYNLKKIKIEKNLTFLKLSNLEEFMSIFLALNGLGFLNCKN